MHILFYSNIDTNNSRIQGKKMANLNLNNQKLQQCLDKGITASRLKDTLTKFGILENERVTVSLKRGNEVLASCEIESTAKNTRSKTVRMSLEAFQTEIFDGFIMPTEEDFGLSQAIPNIDETAEETNRFSLEIRSGSSASLRACFICVRVNNRCRWRKGSC